MHGKKADLKERGKYEYYSDTDQKYLYFLHYIYHGICSCLFMGVSSIREFALPLMVGVVCGAYSSVCITGALWYVMKTKSGKSTK